VAGLAVVAPSATDRAVAVVDTEARDTDSYSGEPYTDGVVAVVLLAGIVVVPGIVVVLACEKIVICSVSP